MRLIRCYAMCSAQATQVLYLESERADMEAEEERDRWDETRGEGRSPDQGREMETIPGKSGESGGNWPVLIGSRQRETLSRCIKARLGTYTRRWWLKED